MPNLITWWLIPTLVTFLILMLIARKEEAKPDKIMWPVLLGLCIVWPTAAFAIFWIMFDAAKQEWFKV